MLILTSCTFLTLLAQIEKPIEKGNYIVGGSISGYYENNNYNETSQSFNSNGVSYPKTIVHKETLYYFSGSPSFGYFVCKGLALGIVPTVGVNGDKDRDITDNDIYTTLNYSVGAGLFVKYYFNNGLYVNFSTQYVHYHYYDTGDFQPESQNEEKYTNPGNWNALVFSPSVGYALFINAKTSLEFALAYKYEYENSKSSSSTVFPSQSTQNYTYTNSNIENYNGLYLTISLNTFLAPKFWTKNKS